MFRASKLTLVVSAVILMASCACIDKTKSKDAKSEFTSIEFVYPNNEIQKHPVGFPDKGEIQARWVFDSWLIAGKKAIIRNTETGIERTVCKDENGYFHDCPTA